MSTIDKQAGACESCRRSKVKCIRDGASCARCRRLRIPCIQRMTSTTFVVRDDNGLPLAAVPPGAASLHSSSASIATTASASAAVAAAAASGPLPPPAPPASLSRPAPSVGGAASAALGLGRPHMRGKGEAPPPLSAREELQLLAVGPRVAAEAIISSFLRHADRIRRDGDMLIWNGTSPPPGPMPKAFPTLARWRHLLQYYSADYTFGLLATVTAVYGDAPPSYTLPPPRLPPSAPGQPLDQQSLMAQLTMLSRQSPISCYRGLQGCEGAPRPLFGADDEQCALMLVAEDGAKGMSVHVTPAFEELVMPVQALGQYIKATRCLPLYAATRMVAQEDLAEFADAAVQTMFLGDGNGMTSIISRVQTRRGTEERCLCRLRALPPAGDTQPAIFALAFLPFTPSLAAISASMAAAAAVSAAAPAMPPPVPAQQTLPPLPPLPPMMVGPPLPAPPMPAPAPPPQHQQQQTEAQRQLHSIQQQLQLPWPPTRAPAPPPAPSATSAGGGGGGGGGGGDAAAGGGGGGAAGGAGLAGARLPGHHEFWLGGNRGGAGGNRPGGFP